MLSLAEIEQRRRRLRFPIEDLAAAAGCDPNTAGQALAGKRSPRLDTVIGLEKGLLSEELAIRDYLFALHGAPQATSAQPRISPDPEPIPAAADGEAVS